MFKNWKMVSNYIFRNAILFKSLKHLSVKVKATYPYNATTEEELSFEAGDEFVIIDRSDPAWWKTEKEGVISVVPATYLETLNG